MSASDVNGSSEGRPTVGPGPAVALGAPVAGEPGGAARAGEHRIGEHRIDERRIEERRIGEHRIGERRIDKQGSGEQGNGEQGSGEQGSGEQGSGEQGSGEQGIDELSIDLNADLGEGFGVWRLGDDDALLDIVTSANVACGFHAGEPSIMRRVCAAAAERGVAIGAQVSYRDLAGFGRVAMDVEPGRLTDEVVYQVAALDGFARLAGTTVAYVKPHGALYNRVVHDDEQAVAVVNAVRDIDPRLPVLGLPGSVFLLAAADAGLRTVAEGFPDRAYTLDGRLARRGAAGALIDDPAIVAARAVRMVTVGEVEATDGSVVQTAVESVCIHGDTPAAVIVAQQVRHALSTNGVMLQPFASLG